MSVRSEYRKRDLIIWMKKDGTCRKVKGKLYNCVTNNNP